MCFEVQRKNQVSSYNNVEKKLSFDQNKNNKIYTRVLSDNKSLYIQEFDLKSMPEITWIEWAVDRCTFVPDRLLFPLRLKQSKFKNIYDLSINIVQNLVEICRVSQVLHCLVISERLANLYLPVEHRHLQKPLYSPPTARNIAFRHKLLIEQQ